MTDRPPQEHDPIGKVPWPMFGPMIVQAIIQKRRQAVHERSKLVNALSLAREHLIASRQYASRLIANTPMDRWFETPAGIPSHLAWQVGHLAMAQHRLCVRFIRQPTPADERVISDSFIALFRRGTQANLDVAAYPPAQAILRTFDAVNDHILGNWSLYEQADLQQPALARPVPHPIVERKLDALFWAARHEMIHAGQIGLIRRALGLDPLW